MKSLAGANPDAKPDYRTQALADLNKLEQKVILLNEMLDNVDVDKSEKFVSGDAYDVIFFSAFVKCLELLMGLSVSKYQRFWWQHDRNYKSGFRMLKLMILNH
jgi:hypothetical protein